MMGRGHVFATVRKAATALASGAVEATCGHRQRSA